MSAIVLVDFEGNEVTIEDGTSIPAGTSGIILTGKDGSVARFIRVDANGQPVVVGAGVAGTPSGGVVSIQGVDGGQPMPITGTIDVEVTNTNDSVSATGAAVPSNATLIGGSDGTNLRALRVKTDGTIFVQIQEVPVTNLYDIQDTVAYVGTAQVGSLPNEDVWTITKTVIVDGNPTEKKTTAVESAVWNDRATETYQ